MTGGPLIWGAGLVGSVALHVAGALLLLGTIDPDPVLDQPVPETRMQLSAHQVKQSQAVEAQLQSDAARAKTASGARLDQGVIRQSSAAAAPLPQQSLAASPPQTNARPPLAHTANRIKAQLAPTLGLTEITSAAEVLVSAQVSPTPVVATVVNQALSRPAELEAQTIVSATPATETAQAVSPQPVALIQSEPDTTTAVASDVMSTTGDGPIDPVSLAAIQSFMRPEDAAQAAQDLRDGIDGLLAQVPCSRLQVQFQPETNTLEVIGHIPEDGLRAPTLAALQAQMGENIRVADNILLLPRPQCGALSGIADVGLPQSTDQITNPLLIGDDVHAREFRYVQGQQLVLDLSGADYDAYVYVDYFDADGQVIHLSPNASTPVELTPAKASLRIGADAPGEPGLFITIGPPYGQEIAVAFASSVPLYQDERPLVEPADDYLRFLKSRISAARSENPDFKGEWVYFFITTAAE
ncbi:DUF4384 domain-containing protein [Ruegeria sp. HKCCA6707]|uniref:DUF4384 domain-containing protein n=1 Tax=unclassified Ruegeria TaxID=2625375 RepID=UPI0014895755